MKKKILITVFLILFIVSIAGVSAANNVNQTINDDTDDLVSIEDTLSVSPSDGEIVGSPDNGTFTDLQNKINSADAGSTIYLENDYSYNSGFATRGITVNKEITIEGNGYTIDALGQGRIFYIDTPTITLKNITFKNGYFNSYYGGAIYCNNDLYNSTISGTFINNHIWGSNTAYGGAIYTKSLYNTSISGTFINNSGTAEYNYGGAIYCNNGLYNSSISGTFINNGRIEGYMVGGAIDCYNINNSCITGTFINNSNGKQAGIRIGDYTDSSCNISGIFINNTYVNINLKANISNSVFINNSIGISNNCPPKLESSWIGNTALNYDRKLIDRLNYKSTLFLDGSSKPVAGTNNKYEVVFDLNNLYDYTTKLVTHPDIPDFSDVVFELSATNGYLSKYTATPGESVVFTSNVNKQGSVTAKVNDISYTINITNLKLDAPDVNKYYNGSQNFVATLTDSSNNPVANTSVAIKINEQTTNGVTDNNGQFSIPLDLNPGNYTVITTTKDLKVFSIVNVYQTIISSDVSGIYKNTRFETTILDSTGKPVSNKEIKFNINNMELTGTTNTNGVVGVNINLDVGNYVITTTNPVTNQIRTNNIVITKANSTIRIIADTSVPYSVNLTANINPKNLSGTVQLVIDGGQQSYELDVENSKATINFDDFPLGTHSITATYSGDINHFESSTSSTFKVTRVIPDIQVTADDISLGEDLVVNVEAVNITQVTVSIGDTTQLVDLNNGFGSATFSNLPGGTQNVVTYYSGNDYYEETTINTPVKVNRFPTDITVSADDISYGENLVVTVGLPYGVAYRASVTIANTTKYVSIRNGTIGSVTFKGLGGGTYDVVASYGGDSIYDKATATTTVTVNKIAATLRARTSSVFYGEDLIVNVTLPKDVAYRASVTIGDTTKLVSLNEGKGTAIFKGLEAGTYTVVTTYGGDSNYLKTTINSTVNVKKIEATIKVKTSAVTYGEDLIVNVTLPSNVVYRTNVSAGDVYQLITVKNGKGTATFKNMPAGTYDIIATYNGDSNYLKSTANTTGKVKKASVNMTVSADAISIGEDLVVNVELPADVAYRPTVTIGDQTVPVTLKNGKGTATFKDLPAGTYNITATYNGDANYLKTTLNTTVKVNRISATIDVVAEAISYGENLVVNVALPSDVAYRASVTIGNETKYVSLTDGVGSVTFKKLAAGTYTITTTYNGDSKYLKTTVNTTVKVNKISAKITASAKAITYGDDLVVNLTLPSDVKYRVSVTIGNETKLVTLTNGKASVSFKGITAGTHDVLISYNGDGNYLKSEKTITARVSKATPNIEITANNITYGNTLSVKVKLPSTVSKSAVVTIGSELKNVTLKNGVGTVKFSGLYYGYHIVNVFYDGDDNYNSAFNYSMVYVNRS